MVDQFISLVNPQREIQPFVANLTGINSQMLVTAPKFFEVAKRIIEITEDCVLVAHNAQFDYRILRTEFRRLGYQYQRKTICTVSLSKKLIPGKESYSLGKLVRSLGIPVSDRHRANGDALATLKLFQLLLDKDSEKSIVQAHTKSETLGQLNDKLLRILEALPAITGVYYMHNKEGEIFYIGKSKNIRKRINQHFTGETAKSHKIQKLIAAVTYEETGSELVALLKESEEIKKLRPKFNRSQRRKLYYYGIYDELDQNGYQSVCIEKIRKEGNPIATFSTYNQARSFVFKATEDFELCQKLMGIDPQRKVCFNYQIQNCKGACAQEEDTISYNKRFEKFKTHYAFENISMVLIDKGRSTEERSAILIENGVFKGIAFFNLNYQINQIDILRDLITPMEDTRDARHIIQSFIRKNKLINKIIF